MLLYGALEVQRMDYLFNVTAGAYLDYTVLIFHVFLRASYKDTRDVPSLNENKRFLLYYDLRFREMFIRISS